MAKKFDSTFLVNPDAGVPDKVPGCDRPTDAELDTWHATGAFAGLPVYHEHDKSSETGRVIRSYSKQNGSRKEHHAVLQITDPNVLGMINEGRVRHVSLTHLTSDINGTVVKRVPTHIATTSDPARAGTVLIETNASESGGVNRYVQEAVARDFTIQSIEDPFDMASTTVPPTVQGSGSAQSIAPRVSESLAHFGETQVLAVVDRALAAKEHQREYEELKRRNADLEAQFKAMQSAAAAEQVAKAPASATSAPAPTTAAPATDAVLKAMEDRFKALEDMLKAKETQKPAEATPAAAAQTAKKSSKEELTDDPEEPSPVRKNSTKRGAPDVGHDSELDVHYRSTYGAYTPDEIERMRQVSNNERIPDAEDGALFSRLLADCIKGREMVDKIDKERYTAAARRMLGDEADEDEINDQVNVFRRNPSVYERWIARNGHGATSGRAGISSLSAAFPGSGHVTRVTEVSANAKSALKTQQEKPKTSEAPAHMGLRGFFAVGQ